MEGIPILRLSAFAVVFALCFHTSFAALSKADVTCADKRGKEKSGPLSCYTCMGRDSENCEWGTVCCKGACFKLVDKKHDIIAKGCTNKVEENASMKTMNTTVKLPWADNEVLGGEMYFCTKQHKKDEKYCNGGSSLIASVIVLLVTLGILKTAV